MDRIVKFIGAILGTVLILYTAVLYESMGLLFFGICIPLVIVAEVILLRILRNKCKVTLQLNQHHLTIDESVNATITLENTSVFPLVNVRVVVSCGDKKQTQIVHLSGKEKKQVTVSFEQPHCGRYVVSIPKVQISDWLSFYRIAIGQEEKTDMGKKLKNESVNGIALQNVPLCSEELYVYPRVITMPVPTLTMMELDESEEREEITSGGLQDQFVGIKEYQPGDRLHKINWKLTAKTGDLLVKQFAASARFSAVLYLDFRVLRTLMPEQQDAVYEALLGLSDSLLQSGIHHMMAFPAFMGNTTEKSQSNRDVEATDTTSVRLLRYMVSDEKQMYEMMRVLYRQLTNWHRPGIGLEREGELYVRSLPNGYRDDFNCIYLFDGSGLDLQHSSSYFTDCNW